MSNSLIDNKLLILYLEEIFWKLNELNSSLKTQDMNIVRAIQIIKAFMNKLVVWKINCRDAQLLSFSQFGWQGN